MQSEQVSEVIRRSDELKHRVIHSYENHMDIDPASIWATLITVWEWMLSQLPPPSHNILIETALALLIVIVMVKIVRRLLS